MIRSIYCAADGCRTRDLSVGQMREALQRGDGVLWVSLEQASDEELNQVLGDVFRFHPLTIEDAQSQGYQVPKIDDLDDYIFLIAQALSPRSPVDGIETDELDFFLGRNYLVTSYRSESMAPVQAVWRRLERDQRLFSRGADFLCYAVLDHLVDEYLPLLDRMDDDIDHLEDEVLELPRPEALQQILAIKHRILALRRIIGPQREIMNRLSRDTYEQIQPQNRIYFRDIYDHLVRIQDLSDTIRDIVGSALDTYLSVASNRLNEVMKALTIVSTIFLPLSFVAGVYGMNFRFMPELSWRYGYLLAWGVFVGIVVFMLALFKRRGWI